MGTKGNEALLEMLKHTRFEMREEEWSKDVIETWKDGYNWDDPSNWIMDHEIPSRIIGEFKKYVNLHKQYSTEIYYLESSLQQYYYCEDGDRVKITKKKDDERTEYFREAHKRFEEKVKPLREIIQKDMEESKKRVYKASLE